MFIRSTVCFILFLTLFYKGSCGRTTLTFVIDETLSMAGDVKYVRDAVLSITKIVLKEQPLIENILLVTFNDTEAQLRNTMHTPSGLMASLNSVKPMNRDYNYECPENSLSGIKLALESSQPESQIIVFTDASANDFNKIQWIQKLCQQKQSQVMLVLTGDCNRTKRRKFQVYYKIATACSGAAFRVKKEAIKEVYPVISETVKDSREVLTAVTLSNNRTEVPFEASEEHEYVIVSACGINVGLNISGPTSQNNMEKIMWTKHAKVVKITNPQIGSHVATARATNSTSVVVAGWTNFYFQYIFSDKVVTYFDEIESETDAIAVAGTLKHMCIMVVHRKYSLKKPTAQILDMVGKVIAEIPLIEMRPNFYTTLFRIPVDVFRVAITGEVIQTGKFVRRIAKDPVTPQMPENYIVGYGARHHLYFLEKESTKLNCLLARSDASTIAWSMNGVDIVGVDGPSLSLENLQINDEGNYTCHVTDVRGSASDTYVVNVGYPPRFKYKLDDPDKINWFRDTEDYLRCDVEARPAAFVEWTWNNRPLVDAINDQLRISEAGYYKCKVHNVHGTVSRSFIVTASAS